MTRNTFLASVWAALLAAVGIGKAQEVRLPQAGDVPMIENGRLVWKPPEPPYPPNRCPVCGTKAPKPVLTQISENVGVYFMLAGKYVHACPTCGNLYTTERPPLRIDGEGR